MAILAQLPAKVSITGTAPYARLTARVHINESTGGFGPGFGEGFDAGDTSGLECAVSFDATILDAARPRSAGSTQVCGFRVYLDGVEVPMSKFTGGINVTIPASGEFATWSLSVAADDSPFGHPLNFAGPPPGKKSVTIRGVYKTSTGEHEFPLVTNGITDNCQLSSDERGHLLTLNGTGPGARYDRKKISFTLKPGHGLARGEVIRRLAVEAGVTDYQWSAPWGNEDSVVIDLDEPMHKELQLVDEDFLTIARDLASVMIRVPHWSRDGKLGLGYQYHTSWGGAGYTGELGSPPVIVVTEQDILAAGGVTLTSVSDVPTSVTMTGTEQMLRDEEGRRTETVTVESYAYYSPRRAAFSQDTAGDLAAIADTSGPAELILVSRIVTETEYEGETIHSERIRTWGWFSPLKYRYVLSAADPDSSISAYSLSYIYETDAAKDDGAAAYAWPTEQFVLLNDELVTRRYDVRDYETLTVQKMDGWLLPFAALKSRASAGTTWETTNNLAARVLGSGDGVAFPYEQVFTGQPFVVWYGGDPVRRETTTFEVDDLGRIQRQEATVEEWSARPGRLHLYQGGEESDTATQEFIPVERRVTTNVEHEEGNYTELVQVFDQDNRLVEQIRTVQEGNLPAAEVDIDISPDEDVYDTVEQRANAKMASRLETRPLTATVTSAALLATKEENTIIESHEWAESVGHLQNLAFHRIMDASGATVTFSMPANFLFPEGPRIHLRVRPIGIDHDAVVKTVTYDWPGPGNPITTDVEARVFAL